MQLYCVTIYFSSIIIIYYTFILMIILNTHELADLHTLPSFSFLYFASLFTNICMSYTFVQVTIVELLSLFMRYIVLDLVLSNTGIVQGKATV